MQKASTKGTIQTTLDSVMSHKLEPMNYPTLTSWLEDSRVKHFLMQEKEEGLMTREERSFLKSAGFSETKDPHIFYSKMLEVYYLTSVEKLSRQCLGHSANWGMMCNGRFIIAKTSMYHKTGKDCILKDILEREEDVEEKYYLSDTMTQRLIPQV